ncbi:MAG: lipopolysaccharide biosynthesis protein [Gemmatimonadetes bacterium]|nr:lipopolysaccharide biosynthesis protein [Gemmatimonadota bacterium]
MTTTDRPPENADENNFSIVEVAAFFLRHRRMIIGLAGLLFVITVTTRLLSARQYASSASFVPQSSNLSGLSGLAAQFGVAAPGQDAVETPAFYGELLKTRELITSVLLSKYTFPTDTGVVTATLADLLPTGEGSPQMKLSKAVDMLTASLKVDVKARTGVVSMRLAMPNPTLAQEVVQRFLDEVNRFNVERRTSKAGAERRFMESRSEQLLLELRDAENRLQAFLTANRDYRNSPDLTFRHDRLAQEMEFRRSVYNTVAQAVEKSRMDEVRDTPVITIIEKPIVPARPEGRGTAKFGLFALIGGTVLGMGIGFVRDEVTRRRAASDPEFAALSRYLADTRHDFDAVRRGFRRKRVKSPQ